MSQGDYGLVWSSCETQDIAGYESPIPAQIDAWMAVIHDADTVVAQEHQQILSGGEPHVAEFRINTPDGTVRWIRNHGYPVRDNRTGELAIYGAAQDITDQKHSE